MCGLWPTPPSNIVADSQFQRMATLYEHLGDLVLKGDASATTEVYQEAFKFRFIAQVFVLQLGCR